MITVVRCDLFSLSVEALVNPVNCVGVMGRGLALAFRRRWPENYRLYVEACRKGQVRPGRMFVTEGDPTDRPRWIVNFPTKRHWRDRSRLDDIEAGLRDLVRVVNELGIESLAMPALGCGLGGLRWSDVRALIERELTPLSGKATVYVTAPHGTRP